MTGEPRYNIRAVEHLTGVPAPTLRSWERRYGFPTPARTLTARRLYTDDDVRAIRWVRGQTEQGLSVAQAVEWAVAGGEHALDAGPTTAPRADALVRTLVEAVRRYDEGEVEAALTAAFAHRAADRVLLEIMTPALVEVGELWANAEISVAAEHFFSNIIRRRLLGLLGAQPAVTPRMTAVLACLPGEQHEIGLLMLALFLRWAGARVIYLGADMPISDLIALTTTRSLDAICLSAGGEAAWDALDTIAAHVLNNDGSPRIYLGGPAALNHVAPPGVHLLTAPLPEATTIILGGRN